MQILKKKKEKNYPDVLSYTSIMKFHNSVLKCILVVHTDIEYTRPLSLDRSSFPCVSISGIYDLFVEDNVVIVVMSILLSPSNYSLSYFVKSPTSPHPLSPSPNILEIVHLLRRKIHRVCIRPETVCRVHVLRTLHSSLT